MKKAQGVEAYILQQMWEDGTAGEELRRHNIDAKRSRNQKPASSKGPRRRKQKSTKTS